MPLEILAGSFGRCSGDITTHGLAFSSRRIAFDDIAEVAIHDLGFEHSTLSPMVGMPGAAIFMGMGFPIASNMWGGDVMQVTFETVLHSGERFLAKADNDSFLLLKNALFQEP